MLDLGWRAIMVGVVFLIDAVVFVQLLREELRERRSPVAARRSAPQELRARERPADEPRREAA